jgi:hypothetical protein
MTQKSHEQKAAEILAEAKRIQDCLKVMLAVLDKMESNAEREELLQSVEMMLGNNAEVASAIRQLFPDLNTSAKPKPGK